MTVADERCDVLVVGGGVVGLSAARALAQRGARVTLLDRALRGGEGSRAAAGVAVPSIRLCSDAAMLDFTARGKAVLEEDLASLQQRFPMSGLTRGRGIYRPALDAAAKATLEKLTAHRPDFLGRWLSTAELVAREPALEGTALFGAFVQEDATSADADSYLDALMHDCAQRGVAVHMGRSVLQLTPDAEGVTVLTDGGGLRAERVVIAGGAWSGQVPGLSPLPVRPVRGQLISVFHPRHRLTGVLSGPVYLAPWRAGEVLVGATEEEAGFVNQSTPTGMLFLLATLSKLAPQLREARFTATWSGLRSATPNGRPMIGRYPGQTRVFIGSGHGGQGILTGGLTGRLIADALEGRPTGFEDVFEPAVVAAAAPRAH